MSQQTQEIRLRVVEALQDDAYKGIARIDSEVMRVLGVKRGDVVAITGGRTTVAIIDRAYPADVGEGIIRVDGIIRRNCKAGIGDLVILGKIDVKEKPASRRVFLFRPAQKVFLHFYRSHSKLSLWYLPHTFGKTFLILVQF